MSAIKETIYLHFTANEIHAFWQIGHCVNCGQLHPGECCARYCTSCVRYWMSEFPEDGDEGRPKREPCPECLKCSECGELLDAERAGEMCYDCKKAIERQAEDDAYWKAYNRTASLTSPYNDEVFVLPDSPQLLSLSEAQNQEEYVPLDELEEAERVRNARKHAA